MTTASHGQDRKVSEGSLGQRFCQYSPTYQASQRRGDLEIKEVWRQRDLTGDAAQDVAIALARSADGLGDHAGVYNDQCESRSVRMISTISCGSKSKSPWARASARL